MNISFMMQIDGNYYTVSGFWRLPHFLRIGDSVDIEEIGFPNQWEYAKKEVFDGWDMYEGCTRTLAELMASYSTKVTDIHWMAESVQVYVSNVNFNLKYWRAVQNNY